MTLKLNGQVISNIGNSATSRHDKLNFLKMNIFTNRLTTPFCNSITYDDFMNDTFIGVFNLSTSFGYGGILTSDARSGQCIFTVDFSDAIPTDLHCLMLCEYPVTISQNKSYNIVTSQTRIT